MATFNEDVTINANLRVTGTRSPAVARSELAQDANAVFPIAWEAWRVWDALHSNLPGTSADDDLALVGGTFGAASPSLQTYDVKAAGAQTLRARCVFRVPAEYEAGQSISIRLHAGMLGAVADDSATVDIECYLSNREAGVGADLCQTNAQDINNTTLADKTFVINSTALVPGDLLDIRLSIAVNDAATVSSVKAIVGGADVLVDIRG